MKKVFLFAAVILLGLTACTKTDEERAQDMIRDYVMQTTNDPSSVQDMEFSKFIVLEKEPDYKYMSVEFRAKNAYGALVKSPHYTCKFDKDVTRLIKFNCFYEPDI